MYSGYAQFAEEGMDGGGNPHTCGGDGQKNGDDIAGNRHRKNPCHAGDRDEREKGKVEGLFVYQDINAVPS